MLRTSADSATAAHKQAGALPTEVIDVSGPPSVPIHTALPTAENIGDPVFTLLVLLVCFNHLQQFFKSSL